MRRAPTFVAIGLLILAPAAAVMAAVISGAWPDGDNIVMDDLFAPASTWSGPAQSQLAEWNGVDTTDNSHPFRISTIPDYSFGALDGDNTMGFLDEAGLVGEYGLSYVGALAWTVCWENNDWYYECDMMLDPALPWSLAADDWYWFRSTVLHEAGHIRGLDHENDVLSMLNTGTGMLLRDEILYMDDRYGVRLNATTVSELDAVIYRKRHDGFWPQWMTMGPTTIREGQAINLNGIYVENRGDLSFPSNLRFGVYLSTNDIISAGDTLLNTGTWPSFAAHSRSAFDWSATIPSTFSDCATRWIGGVVDDDDGWAERFEGNNAVAFSNGSYDPTPLTILLAEDPAEPNDTLGTAEPIALDYFNGSLSIDQDSENDYFSFVLDQRRTVDIGVTFGHEAGNIDLELLDNAGTTIAESWSAGDNEGITYSGLTPGNYYIRVYGVGGGSCNEYALRVSQSIPASGEVAELTMDRLLDDDVALYWEGSCESDDDDYAIYEGILGIYDSHEPLECFTGGQQWAVVPAGDGDRYYLVVPRGEGVEGHYGSQSGGPARSISSSACAPQASELCEACRHGRCDIGPALDVTCDDCVGAICAVDSYCCGTYWDVTCVGHVLGVCGSARCPASAGNCSHTLCTSGEALTAGSTLR